MKKIELNAPLRFVLIILTWLLTFTVVNLTATLNNGGIGLIGTLVLYAGMLFLSFCYFNDCALKKACKLSLLVVVILACCYLVIQCYQYILLAFEINNRNAVKVNTILTNLYTVGRNVTIAVCLIIALVKACGDDCEKECCCKKEEAKEVEAPKEETKEEAKDAE